MGYNELQHGLSISKQWHSFCTCSLYKLKYEIVNELIEMNRHEDQDELSRRMSEIGIKFCVLSGKRGVGKSTIAAHSALGLAHAGKRVGLLDIDGHGPSIPRIFGLLGQRLNRLRCIYFLMGRFCQLRRRIIPI